MTEDRQTDPTYTTHVACFRAVEWMCRGLSAWEHGWVRDNIFPILREPSDAHTPKEAFDEAIDRLTKAKTTYHARRLTDETRLTQVCIDRVTQEVAERLTEPMAIYSDEGKWWPKAKEPA